MNGFPYLPLLIAIPLVGAAVVASMGRSPARIGHHLIETGFGPRWEPNERGIRLEALIDYLVHCVDDWR